MHNAVSESRTPFYKRPDQQMLPYKLELQGRKSRKFLVKHDQSKNDVRVVSSEEFGEDSRSPPFCFAQVSNESVSNVTRLKK